MKIAKMAFFMKWKNGLDTAKNEPQVVASGVCPDLTPLCKRRDVFKSTPTFKSSK